MIAPESLIQKEAIHNSDCFSWTGSISTNTFRLVKYCIYTFIYTKYRIVLCTSWMTYHRIIFGKKPSDSCHSIRHIFIRAKSIFFQFWRSSYSPFRFKEVSSFHSLKTIDLVKWFNIPCWKAKRLCKMLQPKSSIVSHYFFLVTLSATRVPWTKFKNKCTEYWAAAWQNYYFSTWLFAFCLCRVRLPPPCLMCSCELLQLQKLNSTNTFG